MRAKVQHGNPPVELANRAQPMPRSAARTRRLRKEKGNSWWPICDDCNNRVSWDCRAGLSQVVGVSLRRSNRNPLFRLAAVISFALRLSDAAI